MKKNICIIILLICVLGLGGYIAYDKILKDNDKTNAKNEQSNTEKNDNEEIKDLYTFVETDVIGKIEIVDEDNKLYENNLKNIEGLTKDYNIQFRYPVINMDSNDVKNINAKIKNNITKLEEVYKKTNEKNNNTIFKLTSNNGTNYFENYLQYYNYLIGESDDYLSIVECLKDYYLTINEETILNIYIINKKDGSLVTTNDLLSKYNLDQDKVLDFVAKKYNELNDNETSLSKEDFKNGDLDSKVYYYVKDNKLHILMNNSDFSAHKIIRDFEY